MKNEDQKHSYLTLQPSIDIEETITQSAIIFYHPASVEKLPTLIGREVPISPAAQIIRNHQHFWILKSCDAQSRNEIDEIQRLIGLTFTIICIEISNYFEASIERAFSLVLAHTQQSNNAIKLIFIKPIYKNKPHTIEIKYCENISQAHSILFQNNILATKPIKIFDLIQIYDCELPENVAKVRQVYQKYKSIKSREDDISQINQLIFEGKKQKGYLLKQLSKLELHKQKENKLLWKLQRLTRYKQWLEEEKEYLKVECSHLTFKEINSKINYISIAKNQKAWTANSLSYLKKNFNKINTKRDTNSIKHFVNEYHLMKDNLLNLQKEIEQLPYSFAITKMREDLDDFYAYHEAIIEGQTFGFFRYLKQELKYLWNYNNRIYKKLAAFIILVAFAYIQVNFIKAVTILLIALIVLALRC